MHDYVAAREYMRAYQLAIANGFLPELRGLFRRAIPLLEANGLFEDCAEIETLMGNQKRAEMYTQLAKIIKP
ncbi:hypothetical protein HYX08_00395 [Candidatus Woesearchaeota archaeon]|nr:hypothetical protein [Candidatus Woesearchaeota archaeon]